MLWPHNWIPLLCYCSCNGVVPERPSHCCEWRRLGPQSPTIPFWFFVISSWFSQYLSQCLSTQSECCLPGTHSVATAVVACGVCQGQDLSLNRLLEMENQGMLSEEGLCVISSLQAEVGSLGEQCSMLKGTVHNYCSLSQFAAGKSGTSTALDIPDELFPPLPFSASTKHLTSNLETDLHRCAVLPMSSHVSPTKWT